MGLLFTGLFGLMIFMIAVNCLSDETALFEDDMVLLNMLLVTFAFFKIGW